MGIGMKIQNSKQFKLLIVAGIISISFLSEYIIATLIFATKTSRGTYFNPYRWMFILTLYLLVFLFIALRKQIGQKPELLFLAISLTIGSLFAFSMPTNTGVSWDDQIHFRRALGRSFIGDMKITMADFTMITIGLPTTFSYSEIDTQKALLNEQYNARIELDSVKSPLTLYRDIGYLPSSIALALGRILHIPYSLLLVLGRWANIVVYSFVIYFGMRKLITGKMILAVIALFPTAIFLATNYSYDYWVTCFTILGMAYFLSEMQQPNKLITTKDSTIMLGALVLAFGPKPIYVPILFLLFLFNQNKFKTPAQFRNFRAALILAILFVMASFILPVIIQGPGAGDVRGGTGVSPTGQLKFILTSPIAYTKILMAYLHDYLSLDQSKGYMTFLAYLGFVKHHLILLMTLAVVMFTDKNEHDSFKSSLKTKVWVVLVFLVSVPLIATALYLEFTPVALTVINGVQPRYLIPLLFPLLAVVGSGKIVNKMNKTYYNTLIYGVCSFVLLSGIWSVCISKYI